MGLDQVLLAPMFDTSAFLQLGNKDSRELAAPRRPLNYDGAMVVSWSGGLSLFQRPGCLACDVR